MVALATEAMVFSVAGSMTSKRALSDDLRHLPPIHRSVGTLASRFSYMAIVLHFVSRAQRSAKRCAAEPGPSQPVTVPDQRCTATRCIASGTRKLTPQTPPHRVDNAARRRQHDVFQDI